MEADSLGLEDRFLARPATIEAAKPVITVEFAQFRELARGEMGSGHFRFDRPHILHIHTQR
jgi:hypothetical protein